MGSERPSWSPGDPRWTLSRRGSGPGKIEGRGVPLASDSLSSFLSLDRVLMPVLTADRVARRFVSSTVRTAAIAHVDPLGYSWGWFSADTPRMHLVPMDPEHHGVARIWLERAGYRAFEVDRLQPGTGLDIDELRESVKRTRDSVESAWLLTCQRKRWLAYSPRNVVVALYFGTPNQVVRRLRESCYVPESLQLDVATNAACLETRLNRLIWLGADDGSDAELASTV